MNEMRCLLCLLAAILTGCANPTRDVALYRKLLGGPTTLPAYDPNGPLSLHDALRLANADNEAIASKGEDYIQALAEKMKEAGVFLPTISLAPTYNISKGGGGGFLIGGLTSASGAAREAPAAPAAHHPVARSDPYSLSAARAK